MSPPVPALRERDDLDYLGITSIDHEGQIARDMDAAQDLDAKGLVVQLADFDTSLTRTTQLVGAIPAAGRSGGLHIEFETHRNTFLETAEKTRALAESWQAIAGSPLPLCFDFSHFAVVRHMKAPFWPEFQELWPEAMMTIERSQMEQIPVTDGRGRRAPEYTPWLEFVRDLRLSAGASRPGPDRGCWGTMRQLIGSPVFSTRGRTRAWPTAICGVFGGSRTCPWD